jgi:hypothetical protein
MAKKMGLSERHGRLLIEFVLDFNDTITPRVARDRLWDSWGRNKPTSREIGTFMNLHPNFIHTGYVEGAKEYMWGV